MRRLLVDTDPGHDDALALLLLCGTPRMTIDAVTTVAGNASIADTTNNAAYVLRTAGRSDIPLYSGAATSLSRNMVRADVHGANGLDGVRPPTVPLSGNASEQLGTRIHGTPQGTITLLTLGPLTNVAIALHNDPLLLTHCRETVMMGGAIAVPGNKNRVGEFNIVVDPVAANFVFRAPGEKVLIPLDTCNDVVLSLTTLLANVPESATMRFLKRILVPYEKYLACFEGVRGMLLYDVIAAYYCIQPDAFVVTPMDIVVETKGEHTAGMLVSERRIVADRVPNIRVATSLDKERFFQTFFAALARLP